MGKNIKLTPLSFAVAACITYAIYGLFYGFSASINNLMVFFFCFILAAVLFITDLLFRKFIAKKKQIWALQISFILLISILIIIFKK